MAKIVSKTVYVRVTREELQRFVGESVDGLPADFEIVDVQVKADGHRVESVTFGLRVVEEKT